MLTFFATCSRGTEPLVAAELRPIAATVVEQRGGCAFTGELEAGYRACLWSRVASRVLLVLSRFPVEREEDLYGAVSAIDWRPHIAADRTIAVDFVGVSTAITHTHFGAQRVKDAVVDQLRATRGSRPSVDTEDPDVRINLHLGLQDGREEAALAIDLSGASLHRRGARARAGQAPLKENLAAAILLLAGWEELAASGAPLLDPMCGSGTLPIEAAMIAARRAPGLGRERFGFTGWGGHDRALLDRLVAEARDLEVRDPARLPRISASDEDEGAVRSARENVRRAGLAGLITIERAALAEVAPAPARDEEPALSGRAEGARGLFVCNPPYGQRLGDEDSLVPLYERVGDVLRRRFHGWRGAVFTGSPRLARSIGLRPSARHALWNGPIECRLLCFPIADAPVTVEAPAWRRARERPSAGAPAFQNRVEKNLRHLRKWARRQDVRCFRVYDADLPEYAFAVDLYEDAASVQEYAPPATVDAEAAAVRRNDARLVLPAALGIAPENLFLKTRRRGRHAYAKLADVGQLRVVAEGGHRFHVNLADYLDTGLFLDHRGVRALIGREAAGRDFLNLFCYTATASVYAARAGAASTTSVDLSATYLEWAERNLDANEVGGPSHRLVRADVLAFLPEARRHYGLVYCAPPTFSNSKRMAGTFDVRRDHVALLRECARVLSGDGLLLFSSPERGFRLDAAALPELAVEDLSARTLQPDFARSARAHHVYGLRKR